ncbi:UNVERIFIED_CONTAM: hypothetical protein QE387_002044 [Pseudacidovorax intermedius]|nr:hypothetical protein [Pseudacidovorax intermedius]
MVTQTGNLGVGTKSPKTRLDLRSGENLNALGIGSSTQTAADAKAGALRYNSGTKDLSYSDGNSWVPLAYKSTNDFVDAKNSSQQSFSNGVKTDMTSWTENNDVNGSFNPATGVFTASKSGIYVVSFTFSFASGSISNDSRYESTIETNSTAATNKIFRCVGSYPGTNTIANRVAGGCSGIFNLNQGDQIKTAVNQNLGSTKSLDADGTNTSLSIFGL